MASVEPFFPSYDVIYKDSVMTQMDSLIIHMDFDDPKASSVCL